MSTHALDPFRVAAAVAVAVALVAVGVGFGWVLGNGHGGRTHTAVGRASSSPYEITVVAKGWAYGVPLDTNWYGADGSEHLGSRPACIPPTGPVGPVTFNWVAYQANGGTQRQVVSVDCSH